MHTHFSLPASSPASLLFSSLLFFSLLSSLFSFRSTARVQSGLIKRMKAISSNLDRELGRIASVQGAKSSLPPCNLDHHMEQLIALYTKELQLKQTIVSDLGRSPEQQHQLVCLSAWLEQPYLAVDGQHHNDALAAFLDALQHCSRR